MFKKVEYIKFTEEEKQKVNEINLEEFLMYQGEKILISGRERRLESNKSITIYNNKWYDHATGRGGFPLEFVMNYYGKDYKSAMMMLLDKNVSDMVVAEKTGVKKEELKKEFILPPKNINMNRARSYLMKKRLLDENIVNFFIEKGLIYESKQLSKDGKMYYNNLVFVGKDKDGKAMHANTRSIHNGKSLKYNIAGSNSKHSFNYTNGGDRLYVFEAPIDMLSFITLYKNSKWQEQNFVALCGLSDSAMLEIMKNNENIKHIVLCLDNDHAGYEAGERFSDMLTEMKVSNSQIVPKHKDWNEELKSKYNLYAMPAKKHLHIDILENIINGIKMHTKNGTYTKIGLKITENDKKDLINLDNKKYLETLYKEQNVEKIKNFIALFLLTIASKEDEKFTDESIEKNVNNYIDAIKNNYKTYQNTGSAMNTISDVCRSTSELLKKHKEIKTTDICKNMSISLIKLLIKIEENIINKNEKKQKIEIENKEDRNISVQKLDSKSEENIKKKTLKMM